jgi:hypothetical protein
VNETLIRNRTLKGMIIAEYALLILMIVLHITKPYCRTYKGSFGPGDTEYDLAINTNILVIQMLCYVLICLSLFKHERVNFKTNFVRYILISITSCIVFAAAPYLKDTVLGFYHKLFPSNRYFELSEFTQAMFLFMIVFMISLMLSKRGKGSSSMFNVHSILIPVLFFVIATYIHWQFNNFEPGEWSKYLDEVGGNE